MKHSPFFLCFGALFVALSARTVIPFVYLTKNFSPNLSIQVKLHRCSLFSAPSTYLSYRRSYCREMSGRPDYFRLYMDKGAGSGERDDGEERRGQADEFENWVTGDSSLWREPVEYVDPAVSPPPITKSDAVPTGSTGSDENSGVSGYIRTLPLFILDTPFYPEGVTSLHVFEMKYRTMMFDIAQTDDCLGYVHAGADGRLAAVGTLCRVQRRQLVEDGRQLIQLRGVSRFRVRRILKTLPYVVAEVEESFVDEEPVGQREQQAVEVHELETYCALKCYMRLLRSSQLAGQGRAGTGIVVAQSVQRTRPRKAQFIAAGAGIAVPRSSGSSNVANIVDTAISNENSAVAPSGIIPTTESGLEKSLPLSYASVDGGNGIAKSSSTIRLSPESRSTGAGEEEEEGEIGAMSTPSSEHLRRSAFSFAVAGMVRMAESRQAQQLLQTRSLSRRLSALSSILAVAVRQLQELLLEARVLSQDQIDEIRSRSFPAQSDSTVVVNALYDDDSDILPRTVRERPQEEEKDEWDISNIE